MMPKDFFMEQRELFKKEEELFTIEENNGIETVDARELHLFLKSKQRFTDWIKKRIDKYDFKYGLDFTTHKFMSGKNWQTDYYVSVGMAKELSMVENNEQGKQARKYFIEIEKRAREMVKPKLPTHVEALRLYADQLEENQRLLIEKEKDKPKVDFYNTVTKIEGWLTFKEVANILAIPELGRNNLTKRLRELKIINDFNKPYQKYVKQKLLKVIETKKNRHIYTSTVVSQKGLDYIINKIKGDN